MNQFNSFFKFLALLFLKSLSIVNIFIPKKKNLILLYSNNKAYNDNNYALLHKLIELGYNHKYKIVQSVIDYNENRLEKNNLSYIPIYLAPFYFLRSSFVFYDGGTVKITPTKKQTVITLWHGIPLKKIGLELDKKNTFLDKYNQFTKIIAPHSNLAGLFARSFGCDESKVLINGYPRNDFLFRNNPKIWSTLKIDPNGYKHTLLWMPTYRKTLSGSHSDSELAQSEFPLATVETKKNFERLNSLLQEKNILLVIKPHPYCILNTIEFSHTTNIKKITNKELNAHNIVNYSFVGLFDGLLTDYSSVLFDYLLLDKPIAFTIDDLEQYQNTRGMNFSDPRALMAGEHISTFDELCAYLNNFDGRLTAQGEKKIENLRNQFHHIQDDSASETLLKKIGLLK